MVRLRRVGYTPDVLSHCFQSPPVVHSSSASVHPHDTGVFTLLPSVPRLLRRPGWAPTPLLSSGSEQDWALQDGPDEESNPLDKERGTVADEEQQFSMDQVRRPGPLAQSQPANGFHAVMPGEVVENND